jgi:hypothetical protein
MIPRMTAIEMTIMRRTDTPEFTLPFSHDFVERKQRLGN